MSAGVFILIVFAACITYWYCHRVTANKQSTTAKLPPQAVAPPVPQTQLNVDTFLQQTASEKARMDTVVTSAIQQHERELDEQFAEDVRLKERLSQFARINELDKALVALWEEIKYYPAWSGQNDFDQWNKLHLSGISGSEEEDTASVEFIYGSQRFTVTQRTRRGMDGDFYVDFSFLEDGKEVFAIGGLADYEEYGTSYRYLNISAFKKRGNWAKVLLQCYGRIQVERSKSTVESKYFRADEIKSRFEE